MVSLPIFILVAISALIMLVIYNYVLKKTRLGRSIYGIGGNDQAAELSGINVKGVTLFSFCSMGVGKVTNTIIGALIIMSLTNGMNLMGVDISMQYVVKGIIFVIAVAFDVRTRMKK